MMAKKTLYTVIKTGLVLALYVSAFSALMIVTNELTKDEIAKNKDRERVSLITETLPADILAQKGTQLSEMTLAPDPKLGTSRATTAYRVQRDDQTIAIVFEAIAKGGYGGNIRLIVAVGKDLTILGVRVLEHRETPGIGDYIAKRPSKKTPSVWIQLFDKRSLSNPPVDSWSVKKDGGAFDYVAGATISPRAVTAGVKKALLYCTEHKDQLFQHKGR
jgi:electron transport complex protein RnfG